VRGAEDRSVRGRFAGLPEHDDVTRLGRKQWRTSLPVKTRFDGLDTRSYQIEKRPGHDGQVKAAMVCAVNGGRLDARKSAMSERRAQGDAIAHSGRRDHRDTPSDAPG
jgi:hypothetical protein